jgi:DtxR family transcriptional regulator, Mn-dependent transcriptional regulator
MTIQPLSESTEMYLKAMAELSDHDVVAIARLAEQLNVTPVSANEMARRLCEQGMMTHTPYKGVTLTDKGQEVASNVIRRQRLWEVFLYKHLKIEWARLYELACSLEHATAPEVTEALAVFLGNPTTCPRGNPIPAADGSYKPLNGIPLNEVAMGEQVQVLAVNATATDVLKYLYERGILPGCILTVVEAEPLQGALTLHLDGKEVVLGLSLTKFVIVKSHSVQRGKHQMLEPTQLHLLRPGQKATITHIGGATALRRRFIEMGIVKGETILVERHAPLGDPMEYFIKGYHLALRKEEAAYIKVILSGDANA